MSRKTSRKQLPGTNSDSASLRAAIRNANTATAPGAAKRSETLPVKQPAEKKL
jgi:hypothetical protein